MTLHYRKIAGIELSRVDWSSFWNSE